MSAWDDSDGEHELFGSDAVKAFVERQRHMKNVRDRATGALPVTGG